MGSAEPAWKAKAAKKRESQLGSIPKEWRLSNPPPKPKNTYEYLKTSGVLTEEELEITESTDAVLLLRKMAAGALSAVKVTTAFCKRVAIAQQLIRCCTEMFFEEALETAKGLDEYYQKNQKVVGPLHGLPVSLKDGFNIIGQDTTLGWVCDIGKPATFDDILVKVLRAQGAVLYVKTNVPQSLMMSDSYNHIFKQSLNAFDHNLISGGSSGGEGALVGARGSIVGIGSDIGGSIRIPASLQGLYGLCPTTRRIPWENSGSRNYIVPSVCGPLTTSLSTLEYFTEAVLAGESWQLDPVTIPLPWRHDLAAKPTKPLRIGYYYDDGAVRVQPPLEFAVRKAIAALSNAGHEVFEWDTSDHAQGWDLWLKGALADGGRRCRLQCEKENEPLIEGMLVGTKKDELDVEQGEAVHKQIREYQKKYLARWQEAKVDALITPVQPYVGFRPKEWVKSSQYVGYTAQWNLLDFTALVMPVGVPEPEGIKDVEGDARGKWKDHKPRNESDRYNWEQYDPNLIRGMPVTVQIVAGKFGEEKAVAVAKAVEEGMSLSV